MAVYGRSGMYQYAILNNILFDVEAIRRSSVRKKILRGCVCASLPAFEAAKVFYSDIKIGVGNAVSVNAGSGDGDAVNSTGEATKGSHDKSTTASHFQNQKTT